MNEREVLSKAADLLEEKGWCQDAMALDGEGGECESWEPEAVVFCAMGAVQQVCGVTEDSPQETYNTMVTPALTRLGDFLPKREVGDGLWSGTPVSVLERSRRPDGGRGDLDHEEGGGVSMWKMVAVFALLLCGQSGPWRG